jgi:D-tyrosyl-tRNA(Tyr) deacylase
VDAFDSRGRKSASSRIQKGLLIYVGVTEGDDHQDLEYLARKCVKLRIFEDDQGRMNRSVVDEEGEILCVSQFTLYGACHSGNRPSFVNAAKPEISEPLYQSFLEKLREMSGLPVREGVFGASMQVYAQNDGPVNMLIDSSKLF